jgi:hypothetical protein
MCVILKVFLVSLNILFADNENRRLLLCVFVVYFTTLTIARTMAYSVGRSDDWLVTNGAGREGSDTGHF